MKKSKKIDLMQRLVVSAMLLMLCACGGGGGGGGGSSNAPANSSNGSSGPTLTVLATAGDQAFDELNVLRVQAGASVLSRSGDIDAVATQHSRYTVYNNQPGHAETAGLPYFSGIGPVERLNASAFPGGCTFACTEVFSWGSNSDGTRAADSLFGAIYHRFGMLSAFVTHGGAGVVTGSSPSTLSTTHFTIDLAATSKLTPTVNTFYVYPYSGQTDAPLDFFSNREIPDPVPGTDQVGYPISIQAPGYCNVQLLPTAFTLSQVQAGNVLVAVPSYFLGATAAPADPNLTDLVDPPASANYPEPPKTTMQSHLSAIALIPVSPLLKNTLYEATVIGTAVVYDTTGSCVIPSSPTVLTSYPLGGTNGNSLTWRFTTGNG